MPHAVPEDAVLQEQQSPYLTAWVAVPMTPASPFEQAAPHMQSAHPAKQQLQPQRQQQQQQQQVVRPRRSRLAALLSCSCFGDRPAVYEPAVVAEPPLGSLSSEEADAGKRMQLVAECRAASKPPQLPVGRRLSGHKTWDAVPRRHSQKLSQLSRAETEYYDAESCHGSDHSDHQLPPINSTEELETIASQLQEQLQLQQQPSGGVPGVSGAAARLASGGSRPPWVPETPLLFAPPGTSYVPVPAHTGFAAYWENDMARTTPFPQPIDVMLGLNFLVKRAHKSIPGLWLQENDTTMTVTAKPSFLPPGALANYCEYYDKTNATEAVWPLRRDMGFGSMSGRIYMTADGTLVLRTVSRSMMRHEVESVCEDYLSLEEDGQVVVDRMCCMHVASGKRAVQYQVGRRREHPPSGWGAPMVPGFKPTRTLSIVPHHDT
uniref:Uncharacterized protein n=1 Tax=Tetradesmus obliquus TaxID=3088 RepID=A0A383WPQ1_TETOB|eukprot:jgi/Sobl393_1/10102/SZX79438.1